MFIKKIKKIKKIIEDFIKEFVLLAKNVFYLIKVNWKLVLIFAILNVFVSVYCTNFFVDFGLGIVYEANGVRHLAPNNLKQLFLSPVAIVTAIICLIGIASMAMLEVASLFHAFGMSQIGKRASFLGMLSYGLRICRKVFYPKNWIIIPALLIILPLSGVINLTSNMIKIVLPGFIEDFLIANRTYAILLALTYVILALIVLYYIHSLNFFCLGDDSFIRSCKKSRQLMHKKVWHTIFMLIWFSILFNLIITVISSTIASLWLKLIYTFNANDNRAILTQRAILAAVIGEIEEFFTGFFLPMLNLAAISTLFFERMDEKERLNELSPVVFEDIKLSTRAIFLFLCVAVIVVIYNLSQIWTIMPSLTSDTYCPEVVAHRGDSVNAPENTKPAFVAAKLEDVDWVEFDVHETKDGVIIVSHDDDLERVCGKKLFVHDLTYAETQELEVGSWFSDRYKGTKLSTLDEVLKIYKDSEIDLQIEIKPTAYDYMLEEKVLEAINNNDMHDRCIITSLQDKPLKRIKELDPTMITTYSMFVAWDHIEDIEYSDYFTVEENNIDPYLVDHVHKAGKRIFAWTVNNESTVQYLTYCNVDGILTDDPLMMYDALNMVDYSGGIKKFIYLALYRMLNGY